MIQELPCERSVGYLVRVGRLIIVGFNPWSLLGIRRLYAHFFNDSLSNHCLINPLRLFDWLTLLGFELDEAPIYCGYGLPINRWVEAIDLPALARRESSVKPALNLPCGGILIAQCHQAVSIYESARPRAGTAQALCTYRVPADQIITKA